MIQAQYINLICLGAVLVVILNTCEADLRDRLIFASNSYPSSPRRVTPPRRSMEVSDDPCAPYFPTMPSYSRPGRRISTEKCYEYIWERKVRADRDERWKSCRLSRKRSNGSNGTKTIVGGTLSHRGQFPNMGAIGWQAIQGSWIFKCGCSLISPKFVLTAAHCASVSLRDTTVLDVAPKIVRLGQISIMDSYYSDENKPQDASIIRIIVHPNYIPLKRYYDIALMELGRDVAFSPDVMPVCLWNIDDVMRYGRKAEIAGWGVVKSDARDMSPHLRSAEIDILDFNKCNQLLQPYVNKNWRGMQDHQICAGHLEGGIDTCQGDSGGPLLVQIPLKGKVKCNMHYVIGVTSFGFGCGTANAPGVYTKVSSFIDWIENIVWNQ